MSRHQRRSLYVKLRGKRTAPTAINYSCRHVSMAVQKQTGDRARAGNSNFDCSGFLPSKLKQAPPSPPKDQTADRWRALSFKLRPMDKPSKLAYGIHRRKPQPAKSTRYWKRIDLPHAGDISTWRTIPIHLAPLRTPALLRPPSAEPCQRATCFSSVLLFTTTIAAPDHRASGCRRCPRYTLGRNVQNAARLEKCSAKCLDCVLK